MNIKHLQRAIFFQFRRNILQDHPLTNEHSLKKVNHAKHHFHKLLKYLFLSALTLKYIANV